MRAPNLHGRVIGLLVLAGISAPVSGALAATPQAGAGSIGIRLADVPAENSDSRARLYIVDRLAPGTSVQRRVEITNTTDSVASVAVYAGAAGLRRGQFSFAAGHVRNDLARWTSLSGDVLSLAPGTEAFKTVTINVPKRASAGERYGVVWAEVSTQAPAAGGVRLVNRVGVRMYVSVGPGGAPASNFLLGRPAARRSATGRPLVSATVRNTGQRTLAIAGKLKLSKGPGGLFAGPFRVVLGAPLAPGHSARVTVRLDKRLPRGPWRAQLRLKSGRVQRVATATIRFPARAAASKSVSAGRAGTGQVLLGGVLAALLALATLALLKLSPRRIVRRRSGVPQSVNE